MRVIIKHEVNRIKNGFAARSPLLHLAAHGYSPEVARRNLERVVLLFLKPFERQGVLMEEIQRVGLHVEGDESELTVITVD